MWRTVLHLEWRILRRDRAALTILGIFALFLVVAAWAGGRHGQALEDSQARARAGETQRIKDLRTALTAPGAERAPARARDPRDPAWMGETGAVHLAIMPPSPLAPIAVGQRDIQPQIVQVGTAVHLSAERETETPMSGPTRLTTGAFDPAFLFVVLFPLVIIALSYELLSGERERGTLAMLLSQPVSQGALVLGKAGARALALCGVTLVFALAGLVIAGADLSAEGAWTDIGLYGLVLVTWALLWFALSIWINARGGTSAGNALLLVGVWLVVVVVIPGLVHVAVDALHPPPSGVESMHDAREDARDVERTLSGLEGRHDVDTKTKAFAQKRLAAQDALQKHGEEDAETLRETLEERRDMMTWLRFLSPAIVVQTALEDVAGSGAVRHARFNAQLDAFHGTFRDFFAARVRAGARFTVADLDARPRWAFEEEPTSALAARVGSGALGLLLLALVLVIGAWPRLKKIGRLAA